VFLDLNMPGISGWDFLDFFSHFDNNVKSCVHIYIVSSSIDPADKTKALTHPNVISFISKPLTKAFIAENFCNLTS
jgi:CheY-like chemotaxis protein